MNPGTCEFEHTGAAIKSSEPFSTRRLVIMYILNAAGIPTTTPLPLESTWERFTLFAGEFSTRLRSGSWSPTFTKAGRVLWNWAVAVRWVMDEAARAGRRLKANILRGIVNECQLQD